MSLNKRNETPTAATPLGGTKRNPLLDVPGSQLFRPGREYWEHTCLPFVAEDAETSGSRDNWSFERPASLAVQTELGKRFAAAYALFLSRNGGSSLPLPWIIESMHARADVSEGDCVGQGFFFYLSKLLADFGTYVSAQDVEEHLAAVIASDRSYYEPQDLIEVGA